MDMLQTNEFALHLEKLLEQWRIPGLSIAVFDRDTISATASGFAQLDPEVRATPDTIYDMASTSKSLTAACVGKLVSDNERYPHVQWTTPVSEVLPNDFILPDTYASTHATIEDILSHRTGMPGHDLSYFGVKAASPDTPRSVTRSLRNMPMTAKLRSKYQYNNMMYTVATYLVEELTQQTFADFLQQNFFNILNMSSTYLQPSAVFTAGKADKLASRHIWKAEAKTFIALEPVEQPEGQGAGSLQSTVTDYAKWARALLQQDTTLFPKDIYTELCKPRTILDPESTSEDREPYTSYELYCLGLSVRSYRGHRVIEHDGGITGYESLLVFLPDDDFGLVVCGNAKNAARVARILSMEMIDQLLDVPVVDRVDWAARAAKIAEEAENEEEQSHKNEADQTVPSSEMDSQRPPLEAFTGTFKNASYHRITIVIKDEQLYINALDRSEPFELFFNKRMHPVDNDKYRCAVNLLDDTQVPEEVKAEFRLAPGSMTGERKVEAVGITLCFEAEQMLIWFERV